MLTALLASANPVEHVTQRSVLTVPFFKLPMFPPELTLFSNHIFMQMLAAALLIYLVPKAIQSWATQRGPLPGVGNAIEAVCLALRDNIFRPSLGKYTDIFTPYLWSLFFFLLFCNVLGLIPLGEWFGLVSLKFIGGTSTGNIAVTGTLAAITLVLTVYNGLHYHGMDYVKHFFMGPALLAPGIAFLEIMGLGFKTVALAVRLFANMVAGHMILAVLLSFVPVAFASLGAFGGSAITLGVVLGGVAFTLLEVLVVFLHAFIFTTLTAVFIGLAVNIHHDDHHDEAHEVEHAAAH